MSVSAGPGLLRQFLAALLAAAVVSGCSDDGGARRSEPRQLAGGSTSPTASEPGTATAAAPSATARPSPTPAAEPIAAGRTSGPPPASAGGDARNEPTAAATPRAPTSPRPSPAATTPRPAPAPSPSPSRPATRELTIQDFAFSPRTMAISVGTAVRATNKDSVVHTWTADGGAWDSGSLSQGQSFTFTFRTAGTYTFHCEPHPTMTGSILVS